MPNQSSVRGQSGLARDLENVRRSNYRNAGNRSLCRQVIVELRSQGGTDGKTWRAKRYFGMALMLADTEASAESTA